MFYVDGPDRLQAEISRVHDYSEKQAELRHLARSLWALIEPPAGADAPDPVKIPGRDEYVSSVTQLTPGEVPGTFTLEGQVVDAAGSPLGPHKFVFSDGQSQAVQTPKPAQASPEQP